MGGGIIINKLGNGLGCGIALQDEARLIELLQNFQHGIVFAEQHFVIQFLVNPGLHDLVDVSEINYHASVVELLRHDFDFDFAVVPVKMLALAVVVDETMPIAKMDFFRYFVNNRAS